MHIWTQSSSTQAYITTTRNASKRQRLDESIEEENSMSDASSSTSHEFKPIKCTPKDLWHLHYTHASTTTLDKHKYIKSKYDSIHCVVCIRAKQTRKSFLPTEKRTTKKLERIHSDICGQFPESQGNSIYNLTFLDDYTYWYWVTTISDKISTTVQKAFHDLIKQIETETELKIKYLHSDGDDEYQGDLTPFLKEMSIKYEITSPHSSQSNDKTERLNRTLNKHIHVMLF